MQNNLVDKWEFINIVACIGSTANNFNIHACARVYLLQIAKIHLSGALSIETAGTYHFARNIKISYYVSQ